MSSPLRLGPHFALVGCIVAAAVLGPMHERPYGELIAVGAVFVGLVALVGHRARTSWGWPLGLYLATVFLLVFGTTGSGDLGEHVGLCCIAALPLTLLSLAFFGAFVQSAAEFHDARDDSLAAGAERRFVLWASLIPLDFVMVFYAFLQHSHAIRWVLIAGSAATKPLYLIANERTVRRIRRLPTRDLSDTTLRPTPDVAQVDLGVGDELRVRREASLTYRDSAAATLAVLGNVEDSVQLVRARSTYYAWLVAIMWGVLALIALSLSEALT